MSGAGPGTGLRHERRFLLPLLPRTLAWAPPGTGLRHERRFLLPLLPRTLARAPPGWSAPRLAALVAGYGMVLR